MFTPRFPLARCRPYGLLVVVASLVATTASAAWPDAPTLRKPWDPPEKRALPLRLDEAPELALLRPFRDPKGPPATFYATWRDGPWAEWRERPWFALGTEAPAAPAPEFILNSALTRQRSPATGLPPHGDGERGHWFLGRGEPTSLVVATEQLAIEERWVPAWLQRLDPVWAGDLLGIAGCGRGGRCSANTNFPGEAFLELWTALAPLAAPTPAWQCRERPTTIRRYGGEHDAFVIVRCDGALGDGALARLSVLARPQNIAAIEQLPDEPDPLAPRGEWVPGVHLLEPRLAWVVARISDRFKGRSIYVYSGYRPSLNADLKAAGHGSLHATGRALDLSVEGISNEELLAWCFALPDTGCGYYPRSRFVHVDVRPRSTGSSVWVDGSLPGEPSIYLPDWPGVVEKGKVVWSRP